MQNKIFIQIYYFVLFHRESRSFMHIVFRRKPTAFDQLRRRPDRTYLNDQVVLSDFESSLQHHRQGPGPDEQAPHQGLCRETLVEEEEGQHQGDDHAQLIHWHHLGGLPYLQGPVVAKPGGPGSQAGEYQEKPALAADSPDAPLNPGEKHHPPGHQEHHQGADSGSQGGIHPFDAHLGQDGGSCCENCREQCENKPHSNLFFLPGCPGVSPSSVPPVSRPTRPSALP